MYKRQTLHAYERGYPVTFAIMLIVSIITVTLAIQNIRNAEAVSYTHLGKRQGIVAVVEQHAALFLLLLTELISGFDVLFVACVRQGADVYKRQIFGLTAATACSRST